VRTWEVLDPKILEIISEIPREEFVPARYRKIAYADTVLPLVEGQSMMKPVIEGRMLQSLAISGDDSVLEIGTGSGYITACLAGLAATVHSIDIYDRFVDVAERRLRDRGLSNVEIAVATEERIIAVVPTMRSW